MSDEMTQVEEADEMVLGAHVVDDAGRHLRLTTTEENKKLELDIEGSTFTTDANGAWAMARALREFAIFMGYEVEQ